MAVKKTSARSGRERRGSERADAKLTMRVEAGIGRVLRRHVGELDQAERDFVRQQELLKRQLVSEQSMDAALAQRHGRGRIVSCLEGGYALSALARSVAAHVRVLADVA